MGGNAKIKYRRDFERARHREFAKEYDMKAYLYKVRISNDVLSEVHNMTREIDEVWIPYLNLCVNRETCFASDKTRSDNIREIELEDFAAHVAVNMKYAKESFETTFRNIFDRIALPEVEKKVCQMCKLPRLDVRMCTDHPVYHDGEYCEECVSSNSWEEDESSWGQ